jgi:aryl-alcohol dehydrogenase-like predicted oxidoreductase
VTVAPRGINGHLTNPVGLGCMSMSWGYGTPPADEDSIALLNKAIDLGYNHLDTANIYGIGHNETLIGKALQARRQEFFLASKMGIIVEGPNRGIDCAPESIHRCIDETLARLQTDHIDLYYMHRFDPKIPVADMAGAMGELIKAGKIGSYGVSEWSAEHIIEAHAAVPMAAVQTEYSPWTRNPEIAVLETCRNLGITFVAFSPVARGVLANAVQSADDLTERDLRRTMPRFNAENWPKNRALVDGFCAIADAEGVTPAVLSLAWVLSRGEHVVAIPGTANPAHLEENIARWNWQPTPEVIGKIDALINQNTVAGPRYPEAIQRSIDTEEFD